MTTLLLLTVEISTEYKNRCENIYWTPYAAQYEEICEPVWDIAFNQYEDDNK